MSSDRAADRVYLAVRRGILDGGRALGSRLREEELAGELGVSRTPVREALRRLESDGLVVLQPHRGAVVAQYDEDDLEEIFGLRALLEGFGARRAASRIGAPELDRLDELCDRMEAQVARPRPDLDEVSALNLDLHQSVLAAAGNSRLVALLSTVVQVPLVQRTFQRYSPAALSRSMGHHRELVAALRAGDGLWAESVMRSHVMAARATLLATAPVLAGPAALETG